MDEAVRRFIRIGNNQGVIINFDADCTCSRNYLQIIEMVFNENDITGANPLDHTAQTITLTMSQWELGVGYSWKF